MVWEQYSEAAFTGVNVGDVLGDCRYLLCV